jgi:hypothetical protein
MRAPAGHHLCGRRAGTASRQRCKLWVQKNLKNTEILLLLGVERHVAVLVLLCILLHQLGLFVVLLLAHAHAPLTVSPSFTSLSPLPRWAAGAHPQRSTFASPHGCQKPPKAIGLVSAAPGSHVFAAPFRRPKAPRPSCRRQASQQGGQVRCSGGQVFRMMVLIREVVFFIETHQLYLFLNRRRDAS